MDTVGLELYSDARDYVRGALEIIFVYFWAINLWGAVTEALRERRGRGLGLRFNHVIDFLQFGLTGASWRQSRVQHPDTLMQLLCSYHRRSTESSPPVWRRR